MPFFSVVIPLYNKEAFIEDTIKSVLNQSFQDFEVVVVDDGSTDKSLSIVESLKDNRIKIFTTENNGVSKARNYGIKKSDANLIAFLDADDIWYPYHLMDLKNLYQLYPYCGMYCKAYIQIINKTTIQPTYKNIPKLTNWKGIVFDFFESSSINCIAWTSAVAIPKVVLNSGGAFDELITFGAGEDTDLWLRIALDYPIAFHNKISAVHMLHADNRISNSNTNQRHFINLDKYEHIAKKNKALKTFLDLNRYSISLQYRLAGNELKAKEYKDKIDKSSLNKKQLFLIKSNKLFLEIMIILKNSLSKLHINLSSFR